MFGLLRRSFSSSSSLSLSSSLSCFERQIDWEAQAWNKAAESYDQTFDQKFRSYASEVLSLLGSDSSQKEKGHILDVGAGSGALSVLAAEQGYDVTATDFSSEMIARLNQRCSHNNKLKGTLKSFVMDGQSLEFDDNTFDNAFAMFSAIFFEDQVKGISEMRRVVKPNGKVFIGVWDQPKSVEWIHKSNKSLLMIKPDLPRPKTISPAFSLADKSEFQTKMEAAGLNQVQIVPIRKTFHVEDPGALWDGLSEGFPAIEETLRLHFSPQERESVRKAYIDLVVKDGSSVSGTCLLGIGNV